MDKAKQDLIAFLNLFDKAREDNRQIDYYNGMYQVNLNTFNALAQAANQARQSLDEPEIDVYQIGYDDGFKHATWGLDNTDLPPPTPIYAEPEGLNILWQWIKRKFRCQ